MILIETSAVVPQIFAKIRDHSPIAGLNFDPRSVRSARAHGPYWKVDIPTVGKHAIYVDGSVAELRKIGSASGTLDGSDLRIHRVDVFEEYRQRGFGLALMQALLQAAMHRGAQAAGSVFLIADESESAGLRSYYRRMGFEDDPDHGATDDPLQYPMKARVSAAIDNIKVWHATKYSRDPVHAISLS